jgi:hypothetical protein
MNQNKKVLRFVVFSVVIYFFISLAGTLLKIEWAPFNNINLVGELFSKERIRRLLTPYQKSSQLIFPQRKDLPGMQLSFISQDILPISLRIRFNLHWIGLLKIYMNIKLVRKKGKFVLLILAIV